MCKNFICVFFTYKNVHFIHIMIFLHNFYKTMEVACQNTNYVIISSILNGYNVIELLKWNDSKTNSMSSTMLLSLVSLLQSCSSSSSIYSCYHPCFPSVPHRPYCFRPPFLQILQRTPHKDLISFSPSIAIKFNAILLRILPHPLFTSVRSIYPQSTNPQKQCCS